MKSEMIFEFIFILLPFDFILSNYPALRCTAASMARRA
jgi:hypothetical protein